MNPYKNICEQTMKKTGGLRCAALQRRPLLASHLNHDCLCHFKLMESNVGVKPCSGREPLIIHLAYCSLVPATAKALH